MTARELAALLGVATTTLYAIVKRSPESLPPHFRVGGWRLRFCNVDTWLAARRGA